MLKPRLVRVLVALVAVVALPLAACGSDSDSSGADAGSGSGKIEVHDATVGVPLNPSQAAVRFMIDNGTDIDDELIAVSSPVSDRAEVHKSDVDAEGRSIMEAVPTLKVPAGSSVVFEAGGLHVMLIDLTEDLVEGSTVPLTLTFEEAGDVAVTVDVVAAGHDADMEEHDDHG
ncbi:MAG: copper chaperone PCu(A)C [Aquihabitans sp.]